jgi:hypothetical protein
MKTKTLYFSMALLASISVNAQTTGGGDPLVTGSCAGYIEFNEATSLQADSIYEINRAKAEITVDGVAEAAWNNAFPRVIRKIAREPNDYVNVLNLDNYPQTEAYAHATYRALWTDNGVYAFITVKDSKVRYQNPVYQWENDAIELFFAKAPGEGFKQVIIPAMVGTTNELLYPAPLTFESGSANGSNADYKVFGFDNNNWDESTFHWAIKKNADGYDMEIYMDKDIVTNGNSTTHYALNKIFAGDVNLDIAGESQNGDGIYIREVILCMLSNSNHAYATSANYGYFKLVDKPTGVINPKELNFSAFYNNTNKEIEINSSVAVSTVSVYNVAGQIMPTVYSNSKVAATNLKPGAYMVKAMDQEGNNIGIQKIVVY